MLKRIFVALVLFSSMTVKAETATGSHGTPSTVPSSSGAPQVSVAPQEDKNSRLFQFISACLAERPSTAGASAEDALRRISR